jgi:hypothetical protein
MFATCQAIHTPQRSLSLSLSVHVRILKPKLDLPTHRFRLERRKKRKENPVLDCLICSGFGVWYLVEGHEEFVPR